MKIFIKWIALLSSAAILLVSNASCGPSRSSSESSGMRSNDESVSSNLPNSSQDIISGEDSSTNMTSSSNSSTKQENSSKSNVSDNINAISGALNIKSQTVKACNSGYDIKLLANPDRGFRMETKLSVDGKAPMFQSDPVVSLRENRDYYLEDYPQVTQAYFYLTGYRDTAVLPQEAFNRMQAFFDSARKWNIKLVLRFVYQYDQSSSGGTVSPGECGEAKQSIMMSHLEQLKPLLEKNKDIILVMQAGMIGAWGEWHSYSDKGEYEIDESALLKKIIESTPSNLSVQVRYPGIKNNYTGKLTVAQKKRVSYHNDSVFGYFHSWTQGVNPGTASYKQFTSEAPYAPIDGEMFWGWQITHGNTQANAFTDSSKTEIKWQNIAGQLAEQRFTTFSLHHSYREKEGGGGNGIPSYSMDKWKSRTVTPTVLDSFGLFYSPGWFKNSEGQTIKRNAFEYLRDYLGYRLELMYFSANGALNKGKNVNVSVKLTNYGFSAAFNIESGFAVLDLNGRAVSTVKAGDPTKWHSRTSGVNATHNSNGFQYFTDKNRLSHDVSAALKMPNQAGIYKIAFYAKSTNGQYVLFANEMDVINGYHILETVKVS